MTEAESTYVTNLEQLVSSRTEQLREAMSDLEKMQDCVLEALGDALLFKNRATEEHSKRVTAFSICLCRAMGLSPDRIREIARGAYLHDIGKLGIPESILKKLAPLTEDEKRTMQQHCALGHQIVNKIKFLSPVAAFIYAHHERWDGTGYPNGSAADRIPLGARVISVANELDHLVTEQLYRHAMSVEDAIREISLREGTEFDPHIIRILPSIPTSLWHDVSKEMNQYTCMP